MSSNLFMASSADLYVLLYSESQGCFHIETASAMIRKNLRMYLTGKSGDYVVLAMGSSRDEMHDLRRQIVAARNDGAVIDGLEWQETDG
ncbi:hypothetical protein GB832_18660 [Salmonella enterica]|nr:hypothetical protein [Salmonella enterica subsp. enterica serovar Teko]EDF5505986.1 hypothetical protein [Salmonella enterica]